MRKKEAPLTWRPGRIAAAAFAIVLAAATVADSSQTALGLRFQHDIFVQEYWRHGQPCYLIANTGDQEATIRVSRWTKEKGPGDILSEWRVDAKGYRIVDANDFSRQSWLEFTILNGPSLGIMEAPVSSQKEAPIASFVGLNGSGGRNLEVWFEHQEIEVSADARISIVLHLVADFGTLFLDRTRPFVSEGRLVDDPPLRSAYLQSAVSSTLPVRFTDDRVVIEAVKSGEVKNHEVRLEYHIPDGTKTPLVMITGWVQQQPGRGHGLVRGLAVQGN